jgi:hypothetical protein
VAAAAAHRQREQQHDGAEGELAEDDLNRAEPAKGQLDEQKPRPPQHREEVEA